MPPKRVTKPSFKPTDDERKMVEQMAAVGIPQESIARVIREGIDAKTLRKHFREELDTAVTKANAKVGGTLFNKAMSGDTTALIWWSKTRMGWKETVNVNGSHTVHHKSEPVSETAAWIDGLLTGSSDSEAEDTRH